MRQGPMNGPSEGQGADEEIDELIDQGVIDAQRAERRRARSREIDEAYQAREADKRFAWEQARDKLGKRGVRGGCVKVGHNTWLQESTRTMGAYAIVYHATEVVTIHEDGTYSLNTGGWTTNTTKLRLNRFSPARIWSHKGDWTCNGHEYADGMRVDGFGEPCDIIPRGR